MDDLSPEATRCGRLFKHLPHDLEDGRRCPGRHKTAGSLSELIRRRPELADITPTAIAYQGRIMNA